MFVRATLSFHANKVRPKSVVYVTMARPFVIRRVPRRPLTFSPRIQHDTNTTLSTSAIIFPLILLHQTKSFKFLQVREKERKGPGDDTG